MDRHGLVRGTPRWFAFWSDKLDRMRFDEKVDLTGLTLADVDAMREMDEKERAARGVPNTADGPVEFEDFDAQEPY